MASGRMVGVAGEMRRGGASKKRDQIEGPIIEALRAVGVIVVQISGADCPDLALFHARTGWTLAEIKTGKGDLTPGQRDLQQRAPYPVFRTVDDALKFFHFFTG